MKESARVARMTLAKGAVQALYAAGDNAVSLEEAFREFRSSSEAEKREIKDRRWQQAALAELAADGVVQIDEDGYRVVDRDKMSDIVANAEEDGQLLSGYVFRTRRRNGESEPEPTDDSREALVEKAATNPNLNERIVDLLLGLIESIGKNHGRFDATLNNVESVALDLSDAVEKFEERIATGDNKIASRVSSLEERWTAAQRVLEAMQATLKTIAGSLGAMTEGARATTEASVKMTQATDLLRQVADSLSRAENDDIGRLMRKLEANATESAALRDEALKLLAQLEIDDES